MDSYTKDPAARLDFGIDWSKWLAPGDTITASAWTVPSGLSSGDEQFTTTAALVWLQGGEVGATYVVTNRVTTNQGRVDERSFKIRVAQR